jgi:hypothetical protein
VRPHRAHPKTKKAMKVLEEGMTVYLKEPYLGYRVAVLVEKNQYKWTIELESGKQIEVYDDEFEIK